MSRKSLLLALAIMFLILGTVGTTLGLLVSHEPAYYARVAVPPGEYRRNSSSACVVEFGHVENGILNHSDWDARFTEDQLNSYFEEDYIVHFQNAPLLPDSISGLRFCMEQDRIRVAFRYGHGLTSTIFTVDVRPWLVPGEANVVALEFLGLTAGVLPMSTQWLEERVTELAHNQEIDPTWYRIKGNPVVLLRFQPYRSEPTFQLQKLEVSDKLLRITGSPIDRSGPGNVTMREGNPYIKD